METHVFAQVKCKEKSKKKIKKSVILCVTVDRAHSWSKHLKRGSVMTYC